MPQSKLDSIKAMWHQVDGSFDAAMTKCTTPEQRQELRDIHTNAQATFLKAVADGLEKDSELLNQLHEELKVANEDVMKAKTNLDNIVVFLNAATAAVKLAISLVTLAVS